MKKSFNKTELFHKFAERSQESGKSHGVFFENTNKIYSYGYHYLLGEFKTLENGEVIIIIDNRGYSNSTSKHISELQSATRQYKQVFTRQYDNYLVLNQLQELRTLLSKARKPQNFLDSANRLYNTYKENCELFNRPLNQNIIDIMVYFNYDSYKEVIEKYAKAEKLRKQKQLEDAKIKDAEQIAKFYNYEIDYIYRNNGVDYVRLNLDKTSVETSQRVVVSIKEAKLLYKMILNAENIHGHRISNYIVDSINGVLKVGCHNIAIESVHKVGQQLLLLDC